MKNLFPLLLALLAFPASAHEFPLHDVQIIHPAIPAIADGQTTAHIYMALVNDGAESDRLLAIETPYGPATLERVVTDDTGASRTDEVAAIDLPPGETVLLIDGELRGRLEGVAGPLTEGEQINGTLVFEKRGRFDMFFLVDPPETVAEASPAPADETVATNASHIEIAAPFARATLPNAQTGGVYFSILNNGPEDDVLVSVTTSAAVEAQLHEMAMQNDIMRMRELPDGIPLPAGETVTLQPSGLHVMLMRLAAPLVEGETVKLTLHFASGGALDVVAPIGPVSMRQAH